jgi:hypothetical protein
MALNGSLKCPSCYFCPKGDDFAGLNEAWYRGVVQTEIAPLLKEYWFDNPQRADDAIKKSLNYA